jgi:AbrB family looped-hinge helix DNA binding protein
MNQRIIELGTVSTRGQIAIPSKIKSGLELSDGEKILFILDGDTLIIKRVMAKKTWEQLTKPLREAAKKSDLREEEITGIIHKFRKEKKRK